MSARFEQDLQRFRNRALWVGIVALAASVIGAFFEPRQFFVSYLFAYLFWLGLAVGCVLIGMIHHLTGGRWGHAVRRFMEAGFSTMPLLALLFIPILFGRAELYPWAGAGEMAETLRKKQPYLGFLFFTVRAVLILGLWAWMAARLRSWSLRQDETDDAGPTRRLSALSGGGLVLIPLTATFGYIDWIMSTEPRWYSTVFAVVLMAGQVLAAFCFAVLLLKRFEIVPALAAVASRKAYHQLGNFMLTFVLFWTYLGFSQLLIIYSANKPEEIAWYLHRIAGGWKYLLAAIALFHFFLPFVLLLFRGLKRSGAFLAKLAGLILLVHLLYSYWLVGPSVFHDGIHFNWLNGAVPIGLGGVWLAAFFWLLQRAPLVPLRDPRMREEAAHGQR